MTNPIRLLLGILTLAACTPALFAQGSATTIPAAGSQSPALNTFGSQLLHNLTATFTSRQNLLPLAIGGGATAVSSIWDQDVKEFFENPNKAAKLGEVGHWLGGAAVLGGVAGGSLLIGYKSNNHRLRRVGYDLSQSFILVQGTTQALKFAVGRERPDGTNSQSFPSGHSSGSFAMAVVIAHHYPEAAFPAFGVAGFVAFSRLVKDRHWLSDTVGGVTLGLIMGMTVVREDMKLSVGKVTFTPHIPLGGGIGVNASFNL